MNYLEGLNRALEIVIEVETEYGFSIDSSRIRDKIEQELKKEENIIILTLKERLEDFKK